MSVNEGLYAALVGLSDLTAVLGKYEGSPSVHTRYPLPDDAGYPLTRVSPPMGGSNQDMLNVLVPVVLRNIMVYGYQPKDYRAVEQAIQIIHDFFHKNKFAFTVCGYKVIDIQASEPQPAPASDEKTVGMMTMLTIRMQKL